MKSDLVRLIEEFEVKYERLQAENLRLKRKINRMMKKEKQQSLEHRSYRSLSRKYSRDTKNSFMRRNSVASSMNLAVDTSQNTNDPRQTTLHQNKFSKRKANK